jgi:hypothetical protein
LAVGAFLCLFAVFSIGSANARVAFSGEATPQFNDGTSEFVSGNPKICYPIFWLWLYPYKFII